MHEFVPLMDPDDLPPDLRAQYDATTRPGLRDFILMMGHAPEHFRRYNEAYLPLRFDNHLGPRMTEIVRLAVSQTTRCPVCMAGRVPAATDAGLTEDLIASLCTSNRDGFTDADRDALRAHFTPTQIVEIGLLAAMCLVGRFSQIAGLEEPT